MVKIKHRFLLCCLLQAQLIISYGQAQELKPEKGLFGAADDLYFHILNAKNKDTLWLTNAIGPGLIKTPIGNNTTDVLLYAGNFRHPGLYRFSWEYRQKAVLKKGDHFLYVYSGRQMQKPKLPVKPSLLDISCAAACSGILDTLRKADSTLHTAFNSIATDTSFIGAGSPPDTIHYNMDTLQVRIDTITSQLSATIDSAVVKEGTLILEMPEGITILAQPKSKNLYDLRFLAGQLLRALAAQFKKDKLLEDEGAFNAQIDYWLDQSDTSSLNDKLLYHKMEDDFVTRDLLRMHAKGYSDSKSKCWIGYDKQRPERLLVLFRLIGTKKN